MTEENGNLAKKAIIQNEEKKFWEWFDSASGQERYACFKESVDVSAGIKSADVFTD